MSIHILLNRGLLLPTSEENCATLIAHLSGLKTAYPKDYEDYVAKMVKFWEDQKILSALPENQLEFFDRVLQFVGTKEAPVETPEEVVETITTEEVIPEETPVSKKSKKSTPQS